MRFFFDGTASCPSSISPSTILASGTMVSSPSNLTATVQNTHTVNLSWQVATSGTASVNVQIQRELSGSTTWTLISSSSGTVSPSSQIMGYSDTTADA